MAGAQEPPGGRLTDHISLGVLSAAFSRDLIEEVIAATGKREKRSRLAARSRDGAVRDRPGAVLRAGV